MLEKWSSELQFEVDRVYSSIRNVGHDLCFCLGLRSLIGLIRIYTFIYVMNSAVILDSLDHFEFSHSLYLIRHSTLDTSHLTPDTCILFTHHVLHSRRTVLRLQLSLLRTLHRPLRVLWPARSFRGVQNRSSRLCL